MAALARVSTRTGPDPASRHACVQAINVAPDVNTSSISNTGLPNMRAPRFAWGTMAFSNVLNRSSRLIPSSEDVRRTLTNASGHHARSIFFATACANNADWLYRRLINRDQCSGTGTTIVPSATPARIIFAIHRPAGRAISCLSPCFSAKTNFLPVSLYNSAERPCSHGGGSRIQASQWCTSPCPPSVSGTLHPSQIIPPRNEVSRQHVPHRPKSLSTTSPQVMQRGG